MVAVGPCSQKGQECFYFNLEHVVCQSSNCTLTTTADTITFTLRGNVDPAAGPAGMHNCTIELIEQGDQKKPLVEFAVDSSNPLYFKPYSARKTFRLTAVKPHSRSPGNSVTIKIPVKATSAANGTPVPIVIDCRFQHIPASRPAKPCVKHHVTLRFTLS